MQRMFDMKVAEGSEGLDVLQLVAQQVGRHCFNSSSLVTGYVLLRCWL